MKFQITITKEVIDKSLKCGAVDSEAPITTNCGFAVAYNELIPNISVTARAVTFRKIGYYGEIIATVDLTKEQRIFIAKFDSFSLTPKERYTLVGQKFDVEVPDEVIEYWFKDSVEVVQKIIDNTIIQVI